MRSRVGLYIHLRLLRLASDLVPHFTSLLILPSLLSPVFAHPFTFTDHSESVYSFPLFLSFQAFQLFIYLSIVYPDVSSPFLPLPPTPSLQMLRPSTCHSTCSILSNFFNLCSRAPTPSASFPNPCLLSLAFHLFTCSTLYFIHMAVCFFLIHLFIYIYLFIIVTLFSKLFQVVVFSLSLSQWCVVNLLSTPISLSHSSPEFYSLLLAFHTFTYNLSLDHFSLLLSMSPRRAMPPHNSHSLFSPLLAKLLFPLFKPFPH